MVIKKTPLLGILLVFLLPILAARVLFVFRDEFGLNINPKGELISPPILLSTLISNVGLSEMSAIMSAMSAGKWQLIYLRPPHCTEECDQHVDLLNRVRLSLGKHQDRVVTQQFPYTPTLPWKENTILIADPKGFLMMAYTDSNTSDSNTSGSIVSHTAVKTTVKDPNIIDGLPPSAAKARKVLTDMRRLLKFSEDR